MFQTYEAEFEKHGVLRAQTLNEGLNGAIRTVEQLFSGYSDGILKDIMIEAEADGIVLKSGMVIYQGKIYYLDKEVRINIQPNNKKEFLKLRFEEVQHRHGMRIWTTDLVLDEQETIRNNEMELCRFEHQTGAKLRTTYNSFQDYGVTYNVVNIVHAPYAAYGESTISPQITQSFGDEMLQSELTDPYDIAFCFECRRKEAVSRKSIVHYLRHKLHIQNENISNHEIYTYLSRILEKRGKTSHMGNAGPRERRLIVD
ncbi:MAG: hypothetical protein MR531_14900 [Lachnospiraceae bacterium]|nr:hypothetical protein [Lachnospiraceae bacterium]